MTIDFSQIQNFDDLCREVGRSVLFGFEVGSIDFAKKPKKARMSHNCKPSRSHGCVRKDGSIYCVSLARKCRMGVSVKGKPVADYITTNVAGTKAKSTDKTADKTPDWKAHLTKDELDLFERARNPANGSDFDLATAQDIQRSAIAKAKVGTGSNKAISEDLVIGPDRLSGHTAADLDAALNSIPGGKARVSQLRQFVNDQQIAVVFNNQPNGTPPGDAINGKIASRIGADPYYVEAKSGSLGYTAQHINHVVVTPLIDLAYDRKDEAAALKAVASAASKPIAEKPFSGSGGFGTSLYTYLHEVGHQVDFKSRLVDRRSGRQIDIEKLTPTRYGATNKQEAFAESFALYMMHGEKYAKSHPESAAWVKERLDWVTTK